MSTSHHRTRRRRRTSMRIFFIVIILTVLCVSMSCVPSILSKKEDETVTVVTKGAPPVPVTETDSKTGDDRKDSVAATGSPADMSEKAQTDPKPPSSAEKKALAAKPLKQSGTEKTSKKQQLKKKQIKKHDHEAYVAEIKAKALAVVKEGRACDYARICNDVITDRWTLTKYFREKSTFTYTEFVWNQFAEKWEEIKLSPLPLPVSSWDKIIRQKGNEKRCQTLKEFNK